jgi:flagellar basal-body rod modification protein FlgD
MLAIKTGTQTFSTTPQNGFENTSGKETISAADKEKFFNNENLGDVLNKVADPNYVEPSKMRKVGNNDLDKDSFLKLLLAQLKNQDPTSPMQSHEMAAQLAQFSSLESLNNIDRSVKDLNNTKNPNLDFDALKLIGKAVESDSSKLLRNDFEDTHEIQFSLISDAKNVDVKIKDAAGNLIKEVSLTGLKKGSNEFKWNGLLEDGSKARPGDYKVEFTAQSSSGQQLAVDTKSKGIITGVNFTSSGAMLMLGKQSIRMSDIKSIVDPKVGLQSKEGVNQIKDSDIKSKKIDNKEVLAQSGGGLSDVAMSREMVSRVKKEGVATDAY